MSTWNLGELFESVVDVAGPRQAISTVDRDLTYDQLDARVNRLAHVLIGSGIGAGDRVALVLRNGTEYLEAMLASFKLRAVPVNVNTRYTTEEMRYVFDDAAPSLVIFEPDLANQVAEATAGRGKAPSTLARGQAYEDAIASASDRRPAVEGRSGDDRYILYTGGTTGMPKGVVWRHEDLLFAALAGGNLGGDPVESPDEVALNAVRGRTRLLPASPFTHGTAHWTALATLLNGGVVIIDTGTAFDPARLWDLTEAERATVLVIVGDAFGRPLADVLAAHPDRWDLTDLLVILSGGAVLSPTTRESLLAELPWIVLVDGYGTSETGGHGQMPMWAGQSAASLPRFHVDADTTVLDDAGRPAPPGSGLVGRLARRGHIPIGYLGDADGDTETFVVIDGQRWAIPGDLARVEADGSVTLLGRGSSSINTGGEKVYPEEVEIALKGHPAVFDAVVVGVPDDRFGERVAAVIQARPGQMLDLAEMERHCRSQLASYKIPRRVVVVDQLQRRSSGKADLAWARKRLDEVAT